MLGEVEKSLYCRQTIQARIADGFYSKTAQLYEDVTTFSCTELEKDGVIVDGICAGFPCQASTFTMVHG